MNHLGDEFCFFQESLFLLCHSLTLSPALSSFSFFLCIKQLQEAFSVPSAGHGVVEGTESGSTLLCFSGDNQMRMQVREGEGQGWRG